MDNLIVFVTSFIIIFLVYLFVYFVKRKNNALKDMKEFSILISKYKLRKSDIDYNKVALLIVFINSLIISITGTFCTAFEMGYIWQIALGFTLLMIFIYLSYSLLGKYLKKKERMNIYESKGNRKKMAK